jgi:hypothetical protein
MSLLRIRIQIFLCFHILKLVSDLEVCIGSAKRYQLLHFVLKEKINCGETEFQVGSRKIGAFI